MTQRGYVYRAFDGDGELLYIGTSINPPQRFQAHASSAPWWAQAVRIEIEQFLSAQHAAEAEARAIGAENPRFNVRRARASAVSAEVAEERKAERQRRAEEFAARAREDEEKNWRPAGSIVCTNCLSKPFRLPKGQLIAECECPRCGCVTLVTADEAELDDTFGAPA